MDKNSWKDAYTAGLIDGEGTITLTIKNSKTKNRNFRTPVVSVTSTTRGLLEFLKENYGGHISKCKKYKDTHKESWSWKTSYNGAISICQKVYPFLLEPEKSRRAKMLINEYYYVTKRNGRYSEEELKRKYEFQDRFLNDVKI